MPNDERTEKRSPKNEWMDNPYLLEAAVDAAKNGRAHLPWSSTFSRGWNRRLASREYKCACAWVRRESLRATAEQSKAPYSLAKPHDLSAKSQNLPKNSPDTRASIALAKAVAEREREASDRDRLIHKTPSKKTFDSTVESLAEQAKGFLQQLLYTVALIPLWILFGTDYRHGGIFGFVMMILFVVGIAVALSRFLLGSCISFFTGTPRKPRE